MVSSAKLKNSELYSERKNFTQIYVEKTGPYIDLGEHHIPYRGKNRGKLINF